MTYSLPVSSPRGYTEVAEFYRARPVDAQLAPAATTNTNLITVSSGYWVEGEVWGANRGAATTIRIAVRQDATAIANKHYISYDEPLGANESLHTEHLYLIAGAIVTVYAGSANVSFTFNGLQRQTDVNF